MRLFLPTCSRQLLRRQQTRSSPAAVLERLQSGAVSLEHLGIGQFRVLRAPCRCALRSKDWLSMDKAVVLWNPPPTVGRSFFFGIAFRQLAWANVLLGEDTRSETKCYEWHARQFVGPLATLDWGTRYRLRRTITTPEGVHF